MLRCSAAATRCTCGAMRIAFALVGLPIGTPRAKHAVVNDEASRQMYAVDFVRWPKSPRASIVLCYVAAQQQTLLCPLNSTHFERFWQVSTVVLAG